MNEQLTLDEMIVRAIIALQARGYEKPGNVQIQRAIWNMFGVYVSLEKISHYTDVG